MTAAERLLSLAGASGTAGALLLAIGSGVTAGEALVDYSGLSSATASAHLLAAHAVVEPPASSGGFNMMHIDRRPDTKKRRREDEAILFTVIL